MDAQDTHFSGCTVRGLPIGVPFKTKFVIPEDKRNDFKEDTDVFIILRFENLQERHILDITAEKTQNNNDFVLYSAQAGKTSLKKKILLKHEQGSYNNKYSVDAGFKTQAGVGITEALRAFDNKAEVEEVTIEEPYVVGCNQQAGMFSMSAQMPHMGTFINQEYGETARRKKSKSRRRSIHDAFSVWEPHKVKKVKLIEKEPEDEEGPENRRKSTRIRSVGFRPDYQAIEDENAELDDVDDGVERIIVKEEQESDIEYYKEDDADTMESTEDEDIKPNIDRLNKELNIKSKASDSKKRVTKKDSKSLILETPKLDPDFEPTAEDGVDGCSSIKKKKNVKKVKKEKGEEGVDGLNESDTGPKDKKKNRKKSLSAENIEPDEDELDPELAGLGEKEKNFIKAKRKRQKEKQDKEAKRIRITLNDHPDKYRVDVLESFSRKDRGKAKEECSIEILVCALCEKFKAKSADVMENHLECHVNGELNCDKCEFVAAFLGDLQRHKREEHKRNIHICSVCGAETSGMNGLKDHLGKEHDKAQWKCKICLKEKGIQLSLITKNAYRLHIREAHPDTMVTCKSCNTLYATEVQVQRHLDLGCEGLGTKSYPCDKCGKTYVTQDRVNNHINRVHNKIRRYQCPHCPFSASKNAGLSHHLHVHTGVHPYSCDQCTFSCVQRFQLTSHMRTHTGEKPYKCSQCNYAAAWNVQLKDHVKVHNLPNTVTCEQCGIVLKDVRAFKMHLGKEHAQQE